MTNKSSAMVILIVSAVGFACTLQSAKSGILMGLINSACGAAMVGGLADWFAITALFEKIFFDPHSDVLRNKRGELTDAIVDFATKDLLNVENVQQEVGKTYLSKLLVDYIEKYGGKEKVRRTVQTATKSILEQMDFCGIVRKLEPDIRNSLAEGTVERLIPQIGQMVVNSRHTADFFRAIIGLGRVVYNQPEFQGILQDHIKSMGANYDQKSTGRETIRSFLLNDTDILNELNTFVNDKLQRLAEDPGKTYADIKTKANAFFQSQDFLDFLIEKKEDLLDNDDLMKWIYDKVERYQKENRLEMLQMVDKLVVWGLDMFITNKDWQKKVDIFLKENVNSAIEENHASLGDMIRKKLEEKTDDEIVGMVQDAAGDDIHAIRISGSLVGSVVGAGLYVLNLVMEKILGTMG